MIERTDYSDFQKYWYTKETPNMKVENHSRHNNNPKYWDILLGPIKRNPELWNGKNALDFGCGCGRNLINMVNLAQWAKVDGADISEPNCRESEQLMERTTWETPCKCYDTNGYELNGVPSDFYDFVMSTIVFQHIAVHTIRYNLMQEIFRVMKHDGLFSFQMGFGPGTDKLAAGHDSDFAKYFDDKWTVRRANGGCDVCVIDPNDLVADLQRIGFVDVRYTIHESYDNTQHPQWIYVKADKP